MSVRPPTNVIICPVSIDNREEQREMGGERNAAIYESLFKFSMSLIVSYVSLSLSVQITVLQHTSHMYSYCKHHTEFRKIWIYNY